MKEVLATKREAEGRGRESSSATTNSSFKRRKSQPNFLNVFPLRQTCLLIIFLILLHTFPKTTIARGSQENRADQTDQLAVEIK